MTNPPNTKYTPRQNLPDEACREGAVLQSQNPQVYYRVKGVTETTLTVSPLKARPKKLAYTPELITVEDLSAHEADATVRHKMWADNQKPTESAPEEPKRRARDTQSDDGLTMIKDRVTQVLTDFRAISSIFGPGGKGIKTVLILMLLLKGLSNNGVVRAMEIIDEIWQGEGKWTTKRGVVVQRRRGLRIRGWEVATMRKVGIRVPENFS